MEKLVKQISNHGLLGSSEKDYVTNIQQNTGETLVLSLQDVVEGVEYIVMISKQKHREVDTDPEDM